MQMTINKKRVLKAIALVAAAYGSCLHAQTVDSGSLLRQTESLPKALPPLASPLLKVAPAPLVKLDAATVTVTAFAFSGNVKLSAEQLAAPVAPFLNTPLSFSQLQKVAEAVTTAYREAGWVVRTYLPQQDISSGVVTLQVVEAVFGKVSIEAPAPQRIKPEIFSAIAQSAQAVDKPLVAGALDRALLLMEDLPGVSVIGRLMEGEQHSQTDLVIAAKDKALVTGTVSADNYGSLATGADRLNASISINSPSGLGDLLTADLMKTEQSDYERIAYSLPVSASGARAGVHLSNLQYSVPGLSGTAQTKGFDFSYPLIRSQSKNLNLLVTYDSKSFDNADSIGVNALTLALNAMQFDSMAGGGMNSVGLSIVSGTVHLVDESDPTAGQFSKASVSLSRLQTLANDLTLIVATNMQFSSQDLHSSENIYLGGAGGVRAYPGGEGGGSEGRTLSIELQKRLDAQWTLTGFYDYGWLKVKHNNDTAAAPNQYELQGFGASLSWQASQAIVAKATLAQRIGDNVTPLDADGTKKVTRLWFNTSISF